LTQENIKKLFKNEYVQTAIMIVVIVVIVLGFWYGSQLVLNTQYPALAVASGSMSLQQGPFARSLQVGDLIIIQGVKPGDIYAAPFNESGRSGDILVFQAPGYGLIVHRAIKVIKDSNGTIEAFVTKGDANPGPGPGGPYNNGTIPVGDVVGKVVMRIPWVGYLALFMRNSSGVYIVVAIIIVLVVIEFILPESKGKKTATSGETAPQNRLA
jgi:signal peptidase I